MLVRCEHCGSALPEEATKCYMCGKERTPKVYSRTEIKIPDPKLEKRQKRWNNIVIIPASIMLISFIVFLVCFLISLFSSGIVISIVAAVSGAVFVVLVVFVLLYEKTLEPKIKIIEENPPEKVNEAEYEQRIRDFISR